MLGEYQKLNWQEKVNEYAIDCSLDVAIHPVDSKIILLIIPGVDGSVDGYENKYIKIADNIQKQYGAAVVRMSNPFISSYLWESNVRKALEFIEDNAKIITGNDNVEIRIMAHSAGAGVIAQIAWEYPFISKLLLINPAMKLGSDKIKEGLSKFGDDKVTVLVGGRDPSLSETKELGIDNTIIIDGADHNFSGDAFPKFLGSAEKYLF